MRLKSMCGAALLFGLIACGGDDGGGAKQSITQLIGPAGGTVELPGGGKVTIPANALSREESIKITKLDDGAVTALPEHMEAAGKPFAFEPHGLTFAQDVKIEIEYEGDDLDVRPMKLPREDADASEWTTVFPSEKDMSAKRVSFDTRSFSVIWAARPRRGSGVVVLPDGAIVEDGGMDDGAIAGTGGTAGDSDAGGTGGSGGSGGVDAGVDAGQDAAVDAGSDAGSMMANKAQDAYLKASNAETYDRFGASIALSGDTLVVGAPAEGSDGSGDNNNVPGSGAAYVFVYAAGAWTQQAILKADNPTINAEFGGDVAIDGDTIVVGARYEDSVASDSGAAYVFDRSGTTWTQTVMLKAGNANSQDEYGFSVAIEGSTIAIGAPREDSVATGINNADPGENDNSWNGAGAVYVYRNMSGDWTQEAYVKPSEPGVLNEFNEAAGKEFGFDVAINNDVLVVGAPGDDSNAIGVNGAQANNLALSSGAAYVFSRSGNAWTERAYLKPSDVTLTFGAFGTTVAVAGDVVGIGLQDTNDYRGAVYTYLRGSDGSWTSMQKVRNDDNLSGHNFGAAIAMDGDRMIVGAHGHDGNNVGVNTPYSCCTNDSGAAFEFVRTGNTWTQASYIKASNRDVNDWFGYRSVAISGDVLAVGAASESSNATGINGAENNNDALASGAVYTFR